MDRDIIYSGLLDTLELDEKSLIDLKNRGFTPLNISLGNYKTLPIQRSHIIEKLSEQFDLGGVPGFYKVDNKYKLAGLAGLLIPVRDYNRKIVGLKVRSYSTKYPKYTYISSNPKKIDGRINYPGGASLSPAIHFPIFNKPKGIINSLRITEGELKADVVSVLSDIYTISIPGITLWKLAIEAVKEICPKRVYIAFDADKDKPVSTSNPGGKPYAVAAALSQLAIGIRKLDIEVVIEDWDEQYGKGIDDVLINGYSDKISFMSKEAADEFIKEGIQGIFNTDWIYCIGLKRFININTHKVLDKEQYNDYMAETVKGNPSTKAISNVSFPKVDEIIYCPREPEAITDKETNARLFNMWKPSTVIPTPGDIQLFLDHIDYLLPNPEEASILLDYLAYNIKHQGSKVNWAIMLQGIQGTGKSYIGEVLVKILGNHNVSQPSNEEIHEPYTGWQAHCSLVIVEELMSRGKVDLMNKLKPMITQDTANIREMYKPPYSQPNKFNFLIFTNHKDAIFLSAEDRRYCVFYSPAIQHSKEYYDELYLWTAENIGSILNYFLERSLTNFYPKANAPKTGSKDQLIRDSVHPIVDWIMLGIEDEFWPFHSDLISSADLVECIPNNLRKVSFKAMSNFLIEAGAESIGRVRIDGLGQKRLYALRRTEIWEQADSELKAKEYERWSSVGQPDNPLKDYKPM